MYISKIVIENYRCFGEKKNKLTLPLQKGLTVLVGENDAGKTAIIDAIRVLLGTRDQERLRVTEDDFYYNNIADKQATTITIKALIKGLSESQQSTFAEYLTYSDSSEDPVELNIIFQANRTNSTIKNIYFVGIPVGSYGLGYIDPERRSNLHATYLRPLRDAEIEMDVGRNSRISKILQKQEGIDCGCNEIDISKENKKAFKEVVNNLGITGIGHLINQLLESNDAIKKTNKKINDELLSKLKMFNDDLESSIGVGPKTNDAALHRQMLEKVGITLTSPDSVGKRGLGSNNLLYIACELLLLSSSPDDLGFLLIEEPEAHLHPQRQLKLMHFLLDLIKNDNNYRDVQILATTHSPTLASTLPVKNMVIINKGKILPLSESKMKQEDFIFLERFLDATKANLFFCRGLLIVEGDAENLLLPTIARLIGKDLTEYGVSIVNVGHTGLSRYAVLFNGSEDYPNPDIPVACLHDLDFIDIRTAIELKLIKENECEKLIKEIDVLNKSGVNYNDEACFKKINELIPDNMLSGIAENQEDQRKIESKKNNDYDGENVKGFYSEPWTLEYAIAFYGLAKELTFAALLAKAEKSKKFDFSKKEIASIRKLAKMYYSYLEEKYQNENDCSLLCGKIYELFLTDLSIYNILEIDKLTISKAHKDNFKLVLAKKASKAATAQHLGVILENIDRNESDWRKLLPSTLIQAIDHVTWGDQ